MLAVHVTPLVSQKESIPIWSQSQAMLMACSFAYLNHFQYDENLK